MDYRPDFGTLKSQFNEQITASKKQIINLKSIYGLSELRDIVTTTGTATVTNSAGLYKLTASGSDRAVLDSAERGRYYSGQDSQAGIGVILGAEPVETQEVEWGYFDDNNGFGFGKDVNGLFVFDRKAGVDTKVYQADWNKDKLDSTGLSEITLDTNEGAIYHIDFTWYGLGTISFIIISFNPRTNTQESFLVHQIRKTGEVSIEDPNLPIRAEINNNGSTVPYDSLFVGGRQFSTFGDISAPRRITSERRLNLGAIGTTELPLVSLQRKAPFESISVKIASLDVNTDFDAIIEVRENPTLTSAVFGTPTNHNASETALESDSSATAVSGGNIIYSQLVTATGQGNSVRGSANVPLIDQDFISLQPMTITIRQVSGTGGTATCVFRAAEEW